MSLDIKAASWNNLYKLWLQFTAPKQHIFLIENGVI